jgi:Ca2+:H+ antiporter
VFVSLLFGPPYLTLHFNVYEIAAVMAASIVAVLVSVDGETNWLEGAQLIVVYVILALAFFFLPPKYPRGRFVETRPAASRVRLAVMI